jgi:hypothetical protein
MGDKISVIVQCPPYMWGKEEREKWFKFLSWIEKVGGKWDEGMGAHRITFEPLESQNIGWTIGQIVNRTNLKVSATDLQTDLSDLLGRIKKAAESWQSDENVSLIEKEASQLLIPAIDRFLIEVQKI